MESGIQYFTHAHFPIQRFDKVDIDGNYAFGKTGDTYAAFISKNPLHYKEGTDDDLIQPGGNTFWVFEAGSKTTDGSYAEFKTRIKSNPVSFADNQLQYQSNEQTLNLQYKGDFSINSEVQSLEYPRFDAPYIKAEREPTTMEFNHAGHSLKLDFFNLKREFN
jgi:hypothetical protein